MQLTISTDQKIINTLILNSSFIDNLGLMYGKMGISIFFYHLARQTGNKIYEDYAGELIDEIYDEIRVHTPVDFENGLAGIGWGIEHLAQNGFIEADTDEVLEEFDNRIFKELITIPHDNGLLKGLIGLGAYFLKRIKNTGFNNEKETTLTKSLIYIVNELEHETQKKINNQQVVYHLSENKKHEETFEEFSKKISGAVVVFEAGKHSGEKDYRQLRQNEVLNNNLLSLLIASLVFTGAWIFSLTNGSFFIQAGYLFWALLTTKAIGLAASVFLVLHELKVHTPIADKICGFSSKTDCDAVLSSNASRLFGWINWADAGLIYFTATFLYLAGANGIDSLWPLAVISMLALPYPVFSIYYQAVKTRKWCPFCLIVQIVLFAEFMLLFPFLQHTISSIANVLQLAASFLIPAALWFLFKAYRNTLQEYNKVRYSFLGFKRNPEIFRFLLTNNSQEEIPVTQNSLVLGDPDAPITITAFLSFYCNPCANAFKQLKKLLDDCPELKINAVFSVYNDDESKKLINTLYFIYLNRSLINAVDFLYKWYNTEKQKRKSLYEKERLPENYDVTETVAVENKTLFNTLNVSGTPTIFVHGFKYPKQYEYKDLEYYIDELKKLITESKRQEACAKCR